MIARRTSCVLVLLAGSLAIAEDTRQSAAPAVEQPVYESIADIDIGRVFTDPATRKRLDRNRSNPPTSTVGDGAIPQSPDEDGHRDRRPAGFIARGAGKVLHWKDGDFVIEGGRGKAVAFPGDVPVTVHAPATPDDGETPE